MEQDNKREKDLFAREKVGGYSLGNLLSQNMFMAAKKNVSLSFCIYDITVIDNQEIMKLAFPKIKAMIVRISKYTNDEDLPVAIFDIVNTDSKKIVLSSDREFVGGLGIEEIFYETNLITQWEIPILAKLCRAFVLGDVETIKLLISDYYLKFSDENAVKLRNSLGIK